MLRDTELFESTDLTPLDFCLSHWIKSEIHKRTLDTRRESLTRISDAAVCINKREDQLRRTTCDIGSRVAKCAEFVFECVNSKTTQN